MRAQASAAVASCLLLLATAAPGLSAELRLTRSQFPGAGLTHHLHIDGPILRGDSDQLRQLTEGLPQGREAFLVVSLNSPGGDVQEALKIARHLQSQNMQVVTDVMARDGKAADCASACSYIYLGGSYRFLHNGSRLGVHQFFYVADGISQRSETTREVQEQSGNITRLLSDARVDPGFFSLMAETSPDSMNWVDRETLRRFNVLNEERAFQENEFTLTNSEVNLVMTHVGLYGINRLFARCANGRIVFRSEILISDTLHDPDELSRIGGIQETFDFIVMADRYMAPADLLAPQTYDYPVVSTDFMLNDERLSALLSAKLMDVRLSVKSGAFVGAGFDLRDGKLSDLVESCMELTSRPPSSLGGEQDLEETLSPVFIAATLGAAQQDAPLFIPQEPQIAEEDVAIAFYNSYLEAWSKPNEEALAFMDIHYAAVVDFYDNEILKSELMVEKHVFAERWPIR